MNKVLIMGRIGNDIELKYTSNNIAVTSFTVAVNRAYSKDGNQQTDWINCIAWRQTAEFISRYFSKGKLILLEGSIQTRNYEDKNGVKRWVTEIVVDKVEFCGDKGSSPSTNGQSYNNDSLPNSSGSPFGDLPAAFENGSDDEFISVGFDDEDMPF